MCMTATSGRSKWVGKYISEVEHQPRVNKQEFTLVIYEIGIGLNGIFEWYNLSVTLKCKTDSVSTFVKGPLASSKNLINAEIFRQGN